MLRSHIELAYQFGRSSNGWDTQGQRGDNLQFAVHSRIANITTRIDVAPNRAQRSAGGR